VALPGGEVLCGATPELIAHVRDGVLRTQAVAGTGASDALLRSEKDRHEHELVVADIVDALERIGIVAEAAAEPNVVPSGDIAHLVTPIEARLPHGIGVLDVVAQLHPTAALCGTPRGPARTWIRDHEGFDRGWYGGPIGWADDHGNGTFVVALRCALFSADRRLVRCFGGAGIVAGSDPRLEGEETAAKMRAAQRCIRAEVSA
jgi:salicylate biosynthesis isochorismate synthase